MTATSAQAPRKQRRWSETLKNYWLDVVLFVAFVIDMNTRFTGIAIHEWLGIVFGVLLIWHLMLHWKWITATTKRVFGRFVGLRTGRISPKQRVRYIIDLLLFVVMVIVVMTGLWISQEALPFLGIPVAPNRFWFEVHHVSSELSILLVAVHLALDWKWIVSNTKKYLLRRKAGA